MAKTKLDIVPFQLSKNYARNERTVKGNAVPCAVCGKPIKEPYQPEQKWIRLAPAVADAAIPADSPDQGGAEMGCYPIGEDCLWRNPQLRRLAFLNGVERI
jgi:hypothetical protein